MWGVQKLQPKNTESGFWKIKGEFLIMIIAGAYGHLL